MAREIDRQQWQRARELFGAALECPLEERDDFLDRRCGSDLRLRRQVGRLLVADSEGGRFLARPALEAAERPSARGSPAGAQPRSIGPYRLIRQLGAGGMSTVWLAVRADREVRRRVAIKCLPHGMATDDLQRRLRRERQILASLDHPHIARLYDAGTTGGGMPYFVMEYIEGEPITDSCDERRLTIEERLELFRTVCSAVHFAHQNLVVHRDIKPGNILVSEDGSPKLLDFGVAKWLNPELTSRRLAPTTPWQQFLTPGYASPEQIRGRRVTTASDVYSLGVLLFELLTGRRPYRLADRPQEEIERMLAEEDPEAPSAAVVDASDPRSVSRARRLEPQQLRRRLLGDLDNVVAKALRREPQRRYGSAEQLAEDLRRHAVGLPITARKPTFGYRAGRFLRRNRVAMGVVAAFTILLLAAAAGLGMLSIRLAKERDTARLEREKATEVAGFLQEILQLTSPDTPTDNPPAREILDRGSQRLAELGDQPELQAELMTTVGKVYSKLGLRAEAEQHLESALEIERRIFEPPHLALAGTLATLAEVHLEAGDPTRAEALLRDALAMRRTLQGEDHPELATVLGQLGSTLEEQGRYQEAEELCRRALAIHRASLDESHPQIAASAQRLAGVLFRRAKYPEARELFREAIARRRALLGPDHVAVAESLNGLALVQKATGAYEASERLLTEALEINRTRLGDHHVDVAANLNNLASLATYRKDFETAESLYQETLDHLRVIFGDEHPNLAFVLLGLGSCKIRLGDHRGAEALLRQALEIRSGIYPAGNHLIANAQVLLGSCLTHLGRIGEAETLLTAAYRVLDAQEPPRWRERAKALRYLIALYEASDRPDQAARYREVLDASPPLPDAE